MKTIAELLHHYDVARAFTDELWLDLSADEIAWRPHEASSAVGWHLGHQAHVAHFIIRNLTAAEPSPDPAFDAVMDSAVPEPRRGDLPNVEQLRAFRTTVAERVHARLGAIATRQVGAPEQMIIVGSHLLTALINHEYQHDQWIGEVRSRDLGHALPPDPSDGAIRRIDGYLVLDPSA